MSHSVHAPYYADAMVQQTVEIVENVPVARDTWRLRFHSPEMAGRILPGQFLMVRLHDYHDPLIGRPFALYDTHDGAEKAPEAVDFVYIVKGKLTQRLQHLVAGQSIDVWGPLGNGFPSLKTDQLILVAGGIGYTPFLALAREQFGQRTYGSVSRVTTPVPRITLCYGARSAPYLAGVEDFRQAGLEVHLVTDDGSLGRAGLVTDLLADLLETASRDAVIHCCGPEPMMAAASRLATAAGRRCYVSLETPMACGIGVCFTCVARVETADGSWDYKRTCVEGPVFEARQIIW
jgi:dihydroorotate dehydrogenase electron transfer subunit